MGHWIYGAAGLLALCVLVVYAAMIVAALIVLPDDEDA